MGDINNSEIPQYIIDELARMLLPEIQKFYADNNGVDFYENCKAEQGNSEVKQK